jgi:hypothetical protein
MEEIAKASTPSLKKKLLKVQKITVNSINL